ncbi:hypothetical protein KW795_01865 [Candidatus Microgenomates bacterium]|nr:hypothetical protein [Candidatus Microgenomates bacterium]
MNLKKQIKIIKKLISNPFYIALVFLIVLNIGLHLYVLRNNNFYFTVDQAKPAVYAREFFENKRLLFKGPETSVQGIYAGPLWNYFISIGYFIFSAHPFGAVFMQIVVQTILLAILGIVISKQVSKWQSLVIIFSLIFYWRFFETALWDFNPFPLITLKIIITLILIQFLQTKNQKYYVLAAIPIFLGYNTEVAGAAASSFFYFIFGVWAVFVKRLNIKNFFIGTIIFPLTGGLFLLKSLINRYQISGTFYSGNVSHGLGTFTSTNFSQMAEEFSHIISVAVLPGYYPLGIIIFAGLIILFLKFNKNQNKFIKYFLYLTLLRLITSFVFYGSNHGWRDWHTLHFYPVILICYLLLVFSLKTKLKYILIITTLIFHLNYFNQRFATYPFPKDDPTILSNEMKVLDWIYTHNENNGFNAYTYTSTFFDYHYQYLFWWYGKGKYGFVPCEYTIYPKAPKETYIPHYLDYSKPTLGCDRLVFLIIESDTNAQTNTNWINDFKKQTKLLESTNVGKTVIEKREYLR